ncbi:hypothetical protein KR074_007026 [Drosophila pseudoananassae]|nr:hypothetical protein KR074_007026 [Drosophila pseudoananassae]
MLTSKDIPIRLFALIVGLGCVAITEAAFGRSSSSTGMNLGIISIPSAASCSCSLSMSCNCCQSVTINALNDNKTLCLTVKLSVLSGSVDLGVTLDGTSVGQFTVSTKNPPTACLPIVSMVSLDVCLKLNLKMAGLSGVQACPIFYTSYNTNQVVGYNFPCVQVGLDGVSLV